MDQEKELIRLLLQPDNFISARLSTTGARKYVVYDKRRDPLRTFSGRVFDRLNNDVVIRKDSKSFAPEYDRFPLLVRDSKIILPAWRISRKAIRKIRGKSFIKTVYKSELKKWKSKKQPTAIS